MRKLTSSFRSTLGAAALTVLTISHSASVNGDDTADYADCKGSQMLSIAETGLKVELAATDKTRRYGLMFRQSMGENCGMLFIFPGTRARTFTMRNTLIPLDIAFIDEQGDIKEIFTMQPGVSAYPSRVRARYALEMNAGWFEKNNIDVDTAIQIPVGEELQPLSQLQ